jgi:hypothetical protein
MAEVGEQIFCGIFAPGNSDVMLLAGIVGHAYAVYFAPLPIRSRTVKRRSPLY